MTFYFAHSRTGRMTLAFEPRDVWIGVYVAERAVYVCLIPTIVVCWRRKSWPQQGRMFR